MADLSTLAGRVEDAPEPIRRTVERSAKPNPLQPFLEASWSERSTRDGSKSEVGSTKRVRTYSPDETLAVVRALRRASDTLNVGVRIDAPHEEYEEDGKTKIRYRAGYVRFEAVTRQKRTRKDAVVAEPEQDGSEDTDDTDDGEDSEQESEQSEQQPEPAWS